MEAPNRHFLSHAALQDALFCFAYFLLTLELQTGHLTSLDLFLEKEVFSRSFLSSFLVSKYSESTI